MVSFDSYEDFALTMDAYFQDVKRLQLEAESHWDEVKHLWDLYGSSYHGNEKYKYYRYRYIGTLNQMKSKIVYIVKCFDENKDKVRIAVKARWDYFKSKRKGYAHANDLIRSLDRIVIYIYEKLYKPFKRGELKTLDGSIFK